MDHYCEKDMNINTLVLTCFIQAPPLHHSLVFFRTIFVQHLHLHPSLDLSFLIHIFSLLVPFFTFHPLLTLHCSPLAESMGHIFLHKHKLMTTFSTGHPLHTSLSLQFSRSMFRDLCHHSPGSGAGGPGPVCALAGVGFKMTRQLGSQSS